MPRKLRYRNVGAARVRDLAPSELKVVFMFGESAFLGRDRWVVSLTEAMADHLDRIGYFKSPGVIARLRKVKIVHNSRGKVLDVVATKDDRIRWLTRRCPPA